MRKLILMRHAKAEGRSASGEDFDRALTERGWADSQLMGRVLKDAGLKPDLALVSAAQRTRDTWAGVSEAFGEVEARFEKGLYASSPRVLRQAIARVEDEADTVMLVGHNPETALLMLELLVEGAEPASVLDRARSKFPTAATVVFDFDEAMRPRFYNLYFAKDYGGGAGD